VLVLDEDIEEVPKKYYAAYKVSQNIVCMEVKGRHVKLFLKLKASDIPVGTLNDRDVSAIGHYGTWDVEFSLSSEADFDSMKELVLWHTIKLVVNTKA
jgi:predicted transport protein